MTDELVQKHVAYAKKLATTFCRRHKLDRELEDMQAVALLGLVRAAGKFDPTKGAQFQTFAFHWITGALKGAIRRHTRAARFAATCGHEFPEALGIAVHRMPNTEDGEGVVDLSYVGRPDADDLVAHEELRLALAEMPDQKRELLRLRYFEDRRLVDVAPKLGISRGYASILHSEALETVRKRLERGPRVRVRRQPEGPAPAAKQTVQTMELKISKSDLLALRERLEAEHRARLQEIDAAIRLFDSGLLGPVVASAPVAAPRPKPKPQTRMQMGALREIAEQAAGEMPEKFTLTDFYAACERISGSSLSRASVSCQLQRLIDRGSFVQLQKGSRGRASVFRRVREALAA